MGDKLGEDLGLLRSDTLVIELCPQRGCKDLKLDASGRVAQHLKYESFLVCLSSCARILLRG